ncbi:DUF4288 domain-containing protein [Rhizohabitans arisaemae]|uniref:DUF4288 domain-containing protein n=1 Tax=Rhizohabitans arisaemae TaxID=2720610 RepID=UPI0024B0E966|nr:DUF4288 domain-containing protein [Rhizohabitans arisaemae]
MTDQEKRLYVAVGIVRVDVADGRTPPRHNEELFLVRAASPAEAESLALARGRAEEDSYDNQYGHRVTWSFVGLAEVCEAMHGHADGHVNPLTRSFLDLSAYADLFDYPHLAEGVRPEAVPSARTTAAAPAIDKVAWIHLRDGRILSTRSRGRDACYLPGGKREPGESDIDTLVREIGEELGVAVVPAGATHLGTFRAQAHGHPDGTEVRMTCYTADHNGVPAPHGEIEEVVWLGYADRDRVSPVDRIIFDHLHRAGLLT